MYPLRSFFKVQAIYTPAVRCGNPEKGKSCFGEIFEEGVGLYYMKCTCIIHDAIDLGQFTLKSEAHRMKLSLFISDQSWPQNNLLIFDGG